MEGTRDDIPTPALVVDLDLLEANIRKMQRNTDAVGISLRPHAKTHKCPEIARKQLDAGAIGISVATIGEAEAMVAAGIGGVLITGEIVGRGKVERLLALARRQPEILSVVDDARQAASLGAAAVAAKLVLDVLIDVDPGVRRTGVPGGDEAVALAETVARQPGLRLRGIHAYSSLSAHVVGFEARRAHSADMMSGARATFERLRRAGLPMEILTGGSTGTYNIDPALGGMTELQPGSYVFMDVDYRLIGGQGGAVYDDFAPALGVLATVISRNHAGRATIDAGFKAFATDRPFGPEVKGASGITYAFAGDEHGVLTFGGPGPVLEVGDRVELLAPHCDPTVNLYDRMYVLRGDRVEAVWQVTGRHGG